MALLSANSNPLSSKKLLKPSNPLSFLSLRTPQHLSISSTPPLPTPLSHTTRNQASPSSSTTMAPSDVQFHNKTTSGSLPSWSEFAARVSGEWDGYGAEFTIDGKPIELPESVVPEAYREWDVQVFDWQTQCPTLASETGEPILSYKLIKLLPTVGCEADAATRHSVDERIAGGSDSKVAAFGYHPSGSYVAVWPLSEGVVGRGLVELEHCLVDPGNKEVRVRVVQVVAVEEGVVELKRVQVFSEQWYGPFRNGEQLGGCAIRESGFAVTAAVEVSEVVGDWRSTREVVASFEDEQMNILHEVVAADQPQATIREQVGLVPLPKQLWCSLNKKGSETLAEIGWLLGHESAMTSRCVFTKDGELKQVVMAQESRVPVEM